MAGSLQERLAKAYGLPSEGIEKRSALFTKREQTLLNPTQTLTLRQVRTQQSQDALKKPVDESLLNAEPNDKND